MKRMVVELDRLSERGLTEQIRAAFETGIRAGALPVGRRLPSTRRLGAELGLSRSTVTEAFDLLRADGLIEGVPGSDACVSRLARLDDDRGRRRAAPPAGGQAARAAIDAFSWGPGLDHFPFDDWQRIGAEAAARVRDVSREADPAGPPALLEEIARRLARRRGLLCDPDQIIVASGMTQGLDLVARTLLRAGDVAVMEDPAELRVRNTLLVAGARVSPVPVDAEGLEIDRAPRFALAHLSPVRQFPGGAVPNPAREARILNAAEASGGWIAEMDDTALLTPPRAPILAGAERGRGRVVHPATFSGRCSGPCASAAWAPRTPWSRAWSRPARRWISGPR